MPSPSLRLFLAALVLAAGALLAGSGQAAEMQRPFVHHLFTDNLVLQRDLAVPVWGWTEPGKTVTVTLEGKSATATARAEDGYWLAKLPPLAPGGPFTLTVSGPQNATFSNVLVGDVWLCSGQSNMEMGIAAINAPDEIAKCANAQIRLYTVPHRVLSTPDPTVSGRWETCTPETIAAGGWGGFSAVGYFFGRHLQNELKVPIGLIHSSWGGTPIEAWTSATALKTVSEMQPVVAQMEQALIDITKGGLDFDQQMSEWYVKNDPGSAHGLGWADPAFDAHDWQTMDLPGNWEGRGLPDFDGLVWFRREFEVPAEWAGKDLHLSLGPIDDMDTTWINGTKIGETGTWNVTREYSIPNKLVKPGRNLITVRVLDTGGQGGIYGDAGALNVAPDGDAAKMLKLAGPWQYHASTPLAKCAPLPQNPLTINQNSPTTLYNGMIANVVPYGIKGAIWYQGESNANNGPLYRRLLPTLIGDWRQRFDAGDFPFLVVQLANFMNRQDAPTDTGWASLREAQALTAQHVPKVGLAVAIDIGEAGDIHPKNKQEVGRRLALAAQAIAYGQQLESSGPVYASMEVQGDKVRLHFTHAAGLIARDYAGKAADKLVGFAIAGEDGHFVWADATIDGETVVVSVSGLANPKAVRYAWADNPACNLYNGAGLPAVPFRTDVPK